MSAGTVVLGILALVWFAVALVIAVVNITGLVSETEMRSSVYVDTATLRRRRLRTVLVAVVVQVLAAVVVVVAW